MIPGGLWLSLVLMGCIDDPDGPLTVHIDAELTTPKGKTKAFKGTDKMPKLYEDWGEITVWNAKFFKKWGVHADNAHEGWLLLEAGETYASGSEAWLAEDAWNGESFTFTPGNDDYGSSYPLGIGCIRSKAIEGGLEGCSIDTSTIRAHTFEVSVANDSEVTGEFVARFEDGSLLAGTLEVTGMQEPQKVGPPGSGCWDKGLGVCTFSTSENFSDSCNNDDDNITAVDQCNDTGISCSGMGTNNVTGASVPVTLYFDSCADIQGYTVASFCDLIGSSDSDPCA